MKKFLTKNFTDILFGLLLVMVFLIPLEKLGAIILGGINIRASQIMAILVLGGYWWQCLSNRKIRIAFPYPLSFYALYLIAGLLSLILAKNIDRGLTIFVFLAFMIAIPFVLINIIDAKEKVRKLVIIILASAMLASLFGLFQFFGDMFGLSQSVTGLSFRYIQSVMGFPRIQSTFIEPLYFANYLFLPLFLSVFLFLASQKRRAKGALFALVTLFFVVSVLTFSKGAWLVLILMAPIVVAFNFRHIFNKKFLLYGTTFLVTLMLIGGLAVFFASSSGSFDRIYRKAYNVMTDGSFTERQEASSVALEAYDRSPFFGIGLGNFGPYFSGYPTLPPETGWPIANNQYLEVLAETGLLGFFLFLVFLASIFYRSVRAYLATKDAFFRTLLISSTCALLAVLLQYFTFSTLYIMHVWTLIGFVLSIQELSFKKEK